MQRMQGNFSNANNGRINRTSVSSTAARTVISLLLASYLGVLLLGPLTNPVSSEHLTAPMAGAVAPVHRALFLGHGYRFFSPAPGPGHFVECRFRMSDGSTTITRFPDRERHWPRLLYHRWFMLAETIFTELNGTPDAESFKEARGELTKQADQLRANGKLKPAKLLANRINELDAEYKRTRARIELLLRSVARAMLDEQPGAESVEIVLFERSIPLPVDVANGVKLDDARYLSEPLPVGVFSQEDLAEISADALEEIR